MSFYEVSSGAVSAVINSLRSIKNINSQMPNLSEDKKIAAQDKLRVFDLVLKAAKLGRDTELRAAGIFLA